MKPASAQVDNGALRTEINGAFAQVWPHMLEASKLADGSDPRAALPHLREAAELLLAIVARLEGGSSAA